jgi:peptidoglycan/xylan/chitin deacetylase (PgdA/CDA1 family)
VHGDRPQGLTRVDIAKRILAALAAHHAPPTYGFINAGRMKADSEEPAVLQAWRAAGQPLGNHAATHMDLNKNPIEAFKADVLANEATLQPLMGDQDWHWFRYPYLHEGETKEKFEAIQKFLAEHRYKVAEVTLDFNDYAYNGPYARCLAKHDTSSIEWLQHSYLTRAAASLTRGQTAARTLAGHDVAHVMLLHIGGFETVMLPKLLDLLAERGFTLTTLDEAARDPVYATDPARRKWWSGNLFEQMEPDADPQWDKDSEALFAMLAAMCK